MFTKLPLLALGALAIATPACAQAPASAPANPGAPDPASALAIVTDLTTQIGARLDGTQREAQARQWALARLSALGLANVHAEPFSIEGWERGTETGDLVTVTTSHRLALTALGNSGATPEGGITAPLAYFATLADLAAAPAGSLAGKIAFIDNAMPATQDGSSYGPFGEARRKGPAIAAQKGALAVVIRSIGTDHNRDPHTGVTNWPAGVEPIPAAAVSVPDALLVARVLAGGKARLHLVLTPRFTGPAPSGNVIGEIPGTDPRLPPILVGCHLDSWDLATGAIDDGAGCAIVTAAALQARRAGPMARTIRVLWAGSEERGGFGGEAYAKAHAGEPHAVVLESDTGAGRVWRYLPKFAPANAALSARIGAALERLGVTPVAGGDPEGGEDVGQIAAAQHTAVIDLNQDMTHYFDLHHTPDDTLDKIDPADLQQNVDVWAAALRVLGEERGAIAPVDQAAAR